MKNLIFFGHNQVGDTVLTYQIIDTLSFYFPEIDVYVYNKNGNSVSAILKKHQNVKACEKISTKIFSKNLYKDIYSIYIQIKNLLRSGDVYISSLLGSPTIFLTLLPFLLWLKFTHKNKIHILQLWPRWFNYNGHLLNFHCNIFSKHLQKNIVFQEKYPLFQTKNVKEKTIALLPGASKLWKSFSAKNFAYISNYFAQKGFKIVILGSKSDVDIKQAQEIMFYSNDNITNLTGKTSLDEYFMHIANASYVITNDSSGQHIAHVLKTPATVLWGRNKNGIIMKSYSWQDDCTLNITNEPYKYCKKCNFFNKFKTQKQILQNHENCKKCIKQNLELLNCDEIIKQIELHFAHLGL